jgi:ribosomal-protein-alanine N-acetyltransferase
MRILTPRLELVAGTPETGRAELADPQALGPLIDATVPATWPPDLYDAHAVEWALARLVAHPEQAGWWFYYFVRREDPDGNGRVLVGAGGYKGPPTDGTVEVGYSILAEQRRCGYATEAVEGLVARAFAEPGVRRVIAETYPQLVPSIGVLDKAGFTFCGNGSESGVIRYERLKPARV